MSDISVTYRGGTIRSMGANETTTLGTSAMWTVGNIGISSHWNYLGASATKVSNFNDFSVALKDTDFNTWTPSTTAKAILATATFGTIVLDEANYDYIVKWSFWTDLKYSSGATLKVMPYRQRDIILHETYRRPRYYGDLQSDTMNYTGVTSADILGETLYYNSSGSMAVGITNAYGFYPSGQTPTLSSATADSPTLTIPRPILNARCSTTYMATARASEIDKTNSTLNLRCEVFRIARDGRKTAECREMSALLNS